MTTESVPNDKILLEIVTPQGRVLHTLVDEVTAPSVKGEFGLLPGHLPVLAALRTGIVAYRRGSETTRCAVGRGFAEGGPNKLSILTDEYVAREGLDPVVVRKDLHEVQAQLAKVESAAGGQPLAEATKLQLIQRENWLAVQLELYGDPPPATMRPHEEYGPPQSPEDEEKARESGAD